MLRRYREAEHSKAYGLAHLGIGLYEQVAHHMEVVGREKIPKIGGAVLVITHRDAYDSIAGGIACPRPVYFMAKKEMWDDEYSFEIPLLGKKSTAGLVAEYFGAFSVDREHPQPSTMKRAIGLAKAERIVGMYPEMSRYEDETLKIVRGQELGYLNPGAAAIACAAEVPLIAMGLKVRREVNKKGQSKVSRIAAVMNGPFEAVRDPELSKSQAYEKIMDDLRPQLQEAHDQACELVAA